MSFDDITFKDLKNADYNLSKVSHGRIRRNNNLLFVKTNEGRYAKLSLKSLSESEIIWDEVMIYESDGRLYKRLNDLVLKINEPYDLDKLKPASNDADFVYKNEVTQSLELVHYIWRVNGASLAIPDVQEITRARYSGVLSIQSNPGDAEIYVDGERKASTPSKLWLTEGSHEIKIVRNGYEVWSKTISIKAGEKRELSAHLTKIPRPLLKWKYETDGGISSSVLGDLNGDGNLEVIFGSYDNNVYALDSKGNLLWNFEAKSRVATPALGDIDKDGRLEIIVGTGLEYDVESYICALDSKGTLLWKYDLKIGGAYSTPSLGDLDGDEKLEVIIGSQQGILYALDSDGQLLWKYKVQEAIQASPTLGDLNGDGKLEVIFGSYDDYLYVLDSNGALLWKYKTGFNIRSSAAIADFDNNGKLEIVFGSFDGNIYLLNHKGKLNWAYNTDETAMCASPAVGDLNQDGELEIAIGSCYSYNSHIYILSTEGKLIWSHSTPGTIHSSPVIGDVDGDKKMEVIATSYHGAVLIFDSRGELEGYYQTKNKIYSSPSLGDLENDGKLEVVVSDHSKGPIEGTIYLLNTEGGGEIQWSSFGGNPWHTGNMKDALSYGNALVKSPKAATVWAKGREITKTEEENLPPKADFTFYPQQPTVGQVVTFEARGSIDSDGTIVNYHWDLGDGSSDSGSSTTHTYNHSGSFTVSLTVTDDDSAFDSTSKTITVSKVKKAPQADFTFSPKEPTDLDAIQFTDQSSDPDGQVVSWKWDFGDNHYSYKQNPSHKYHDNGTYKVTLTITDNEGKSGSISKKIWVANVPPNAQFSFSPKEPVASEPITFDACSSGDKDGSIQNFEWDWDDDKTFEDSGASCKIRNTFKKPGNYAVTLRITDDDGDTDIVTQIVSLAKKNQPPRAIFSFTPTQPTDLDPVEFADESTDPDGKVVSWHWIFGDGTESRERNPAHQYKDNGSYTVKLTVADDQGATDTTTKNIFVSNVSPTTELSFSPSEPKTEVSITFYGCDSQDEDGTIEKYEWDWDDDNHFEESTSSCEVKHTFRKAGDYRVTLKVTDDDEDTDRAAKIIAVKNRSPNARFNYQPKEPTDLDKINFSDESTDPDGEIAKWDWDFGDRSTSDRQNPVHQYEDDGTFAVMLTITDDNGATDSVTKKIKVSNVAPKADFKVSPSKLIIEAPVTFDASASDDPDGEIENYKWNFGDGTTGSGQEVKHKFASEGKYEVKLTITDDDGATNSTKKEVVVSKPPPKIKQTYAIVIGISDYQHGTPDFPACQRDLCDLKYPAVDAKAFYDLLVDPNVGNLPEENVILLTDSKATKANIADAFGEIIALAEENDLVIIYYSGHGGRGHDLNGDEGEGDSWDEYYIAYDTNINKLFATGIRDDEFGDWMNSLRSKQVAIFLDSCFSGGATREVKGTTPEGYKAAPSDSVFNDFELEDEVLISASQENQVSYESDDLGHGVFTHFLLEGLKGEADLNGDNKIMVDEVYEYIKPKVKRYVVEHFNNAVQEPLLKGKKVGVEISSGTYKQVGKVTAIVGNKDKAVLGDKVMISLGKNQGVKVGDVFEVFHEYQTKAVNIEEVRGKIEVIELVGQERALCEVMELVVPIKVGDGIRGVQ